MKINTFVAAVIIFILYLQGCADKKVSTDGSIVISSEDIKKEILLSDYVDSIEILRLETTDQSVFSRIDKIIFHRSFVFILDKQTHSILKFSEKGEFLAKLLSAGNGPEDYVSAVDFDIHNEHIYLLDQTKKQIVLYNLDFDHVNVIRLKDYATNIAVSDNRIFLYTGIYNPNDSYHLTVLDDKGNFVAEEFPYKDVTERAFDFTSGIGFCFAKRAGDRLLFSKTFNNTIYSLTDQIEPLLSLDFLPNRRFSKTDIHSMNILDPEKGYVFKYNFFYTKDLLVCLAISGGDIFYIFHHLLTGTTQTGTAQNL